MAISVGYAQTPITPTLDRPVYLAGVFDAIETTNLHTLLSEANGAE